jgi:hypothetical protein
MGKNPAGAVAAYSDTLSCSRCGKPLAVARPSRMISTTMGLLGAFLAYRLTRDSYGLLNWLLPMTYAVMVWGIVTGLVLMLTADLRVRVAEPYAQTHVASLGSAPATHH